ncbi:neurturin-like [Girardinichthys multiradiatus]|uniref:neurturin-like n=1 Tax=Girardinichthys multiradiatus TaxID=208333 RepID=UPI001FAC6E90|nr:neurturin-like [Girardinichthys multiradiatus]XP_047224376.1 neurturin-like [Girardinichthys multiradiatus]XP_047224377.1 neurturin-like [Girardinichthys multiradiatus]
MKLWKGATFAFVLCAAALSTFFIRNMASIRGFTVQEKHPHASSPSETIPKSSLTSSAEPRVLPWQTESLRRETRSTGNNINSLLSEFSMMLQSFTESELQHVLGTLLDRKRRRGQSLGMTQARRTKRAQKSRPCSLRKLVLTVNELGLGFESDETIQLQYCSGQCDKERQNYDFVMKHMVEKGYIGKGRKNKVSKEPCCRPTKFEKSIVYYGNGTHNEIPNVSAKRCGCV